MKTYTFTLFILAASINAFAASTALVGVCDMRQAKLNITSDAPEQISAICYPVSAPNEKISGAIDLLPTKLGTFAGEVIFPNLKPKTDYKFELLEAKSPVVQGSFQTKPDFKDRTPPPDFSFAVLGKNYINDKDFDPPFRTPGGNYEIFDTIKKSNPNFVIWTDAFNELRNADKDSRSGVFARYQNARNFEQLKPLLTSQANYAVPSATAFYGENADASSANSKNADDAFNSFWANPDSSDSSSNAYTFTYSDVQFFVLDDAKNRSRLDYRQDRPQFLGKQQMRWLFNALENSKAKFKIIVMNSPIANPVKSEANFTFAADERKELLDFLSSKKIGGVLAISANKPYGEITRLVRAGTYPLIEATAGTLTAKPIESVNEMNYFRMPSSATLNRSFLLIKVDGAENSRAITFTFIDPTGKSGFSTKIDESTLYKFD